MRFMSASIDSLIATASSPSIWESYRLPRRRDPEPVEPLLLLCPLHALLTLSTDTSMPLTGSSASASIIAGGKREEMSGFAPDLLVFAVLFVLTVPLENTLPPTESVSEPPKLRFLGAATGSLAADLATAATLASASLRLSAALIAACFSFRRCSASLRVCSVIYALPERNRLSNSESAIVSTSGAALPPPPEPACLVLPAPPEGFEKSMQSSSSSSLSSE